MFGGMAEQIPYNEGQVVFRPLGQTTCVYHKGEILEWFCETCPDAICKKCIPTIHRGHNFEELSEVTPQNKSQIQKFIEHTRQNEILQLHQEINSNQESLKNHSSHCKGVAQEVKKQGERYKKDVDSFIAQMLLKLKKLEDENSNLLRNYQTDLENKLEDLEGKVEKYEETTRTGTDIQMFDSVISCQRLTHVTSPAKPTLGTVQFYPNSLTNELMEQAIGKVGLTRSDEIPGPSEDQISVVREWEAPCNTRCICPIEDDDGAWTCDYSNMLTYLTSQGKTKQQIKSPVPVIDICVSPKTQNLWACSNIDNRVIELVSGKFTGRFYTLDKVRSICVTKCDEVLVGMKCKIEKYTTEGKLHSTITTAWSPRRIVQCPVSENIAVVDRDDAGDGGKGNPHIIVMDKNLRKSFQYGRPEHASRTGRRPFDPIDVAYDTRGCLVVGDCENGCLHLLSGKGQYLKLLHTATEGAWPVGVASDGLLWARFGVYSSKQVKLIQYKL
ncbi:uncharacterized protein LOC110447922 [Mizuhopecten yessoensis]|uniref:uncharacterized protein LOC110447922 n=1 Tax=Mizuhopecten yessoensis TaxID=6573 RepID=UPI000B45A4C7|nr:uncharacterized protein LOC110447922 [Mizuhopecten yessoensis]XP_021349588.1 uncharacterized protein LOC110447922 [Mizuhopecten yessoensis]